MPKTGLSLYFIHLSVLVITEYLYAKPISCLCGQRSESTIVVPRTSISVERETEVFPSSSLDLLLHESQDKLIPKHRLFSRE